MNPKAIDHVCSRLVYVFHWRNVGGKDRINEMPLCASLAQNVGIDATDPTLRHCGPKAYISERLAFSITDDLD
jgi:hypothetical protein